MVQVDHTQVQDHLEEDQGLIKNMVDAISRIITDFRKDRDKIQMPVHRLAAVVLVIHQDQATDTGDLNFHHVVVEVEEKEEVLLVCPAGTPLDPACIRLRTGTEDQEVGLEGEVPVQVEQETDRRLPLHHPLRIDECYHNNTSPNMDLEVEGLVIQQLAPGVVECNNIHPDLP